MVSIATVDRVIHNQTGVSAKMRAKIEKIVQELNYQPDIIASRLAWRKAAVAEVFPVFGFYLQPSVGGRVLSNDCWRQLAEIPNLIAIKTAPFNRYQTLDMFRSVCHSSRRNEIAMYTGNDDNIVADLQTTNRIPVDGQIVEKRFAGGLLGHWSVWASKVVELFNQIRSNPVDMGLLSTNIAVTDRNAALFAPSHSFKGSIAGLHEVLRKQGLMEGTWCLSDHEVLSPGRAEEIERVMREYPEHTDDAFVRAFLEKDKI